MNVCHNLFPIKCSEKNWLFSIVLTDWKLLDRFKIKFYEEILRKEISRKYSYFAHLIYEQFHSRFLICSTQRPETRAIVVPGDLVIDRIVSSLFQIESAGTSILTWTPSPMQQPSPTCSPASTWERSPNNTPLPKITSSSMKDPRNVVHLAPILAPLANVPDKKPFDPIVTSFPVLNILNIQSLPIRLLRPNWTWLLNADKGPTCVSRPTNTSEKLWTALRPWKTTPLSRNSCPLIVLPP